jgi:hypothetical protein
MMARFVPLVVLLSGLSPTGLAHADDGTAGRRHLHSIEVAADGAAGVLRTEPEFLGETPGAVHFGAPHCKGHALGAATLEQLHAALRSRQWVTLGAVSSEQDPKVRCLATVVFWAL